MLSYPKCVDTAFKHSADFGSNARGGCRRPTFQGTAAVLDLGRAGTIEASNDDLFRVGGHYQVRVMSDDDDLTSLLSLSEILDQARIN